ncbi:MAG: hypothetical protein CALGDGBN_01113 [Pseudomonadales bacterium]|nr:hypothetical protein [Pseudomonadales bacterium]
MSRVALVTGASGFVGSALCEALDAAGWTVRRTVRGVATTAGEGLVPLELATLATHGCGAALLAGVDVVFHLAGVAHRGASAEELQLLNRDATIALAAASAAAGVAHFVFVSSLYAGAVDPASPGRPGEAYGRTKREAEEALLGAERERLLRVTVVRPALVYGDGVKGRLATLRCLARRGLLPDLPAIGNTPMLALTDLVAALVLLGAHPTLSGNVFVLGDGERYPLARIARALHRGAGRAGGAWRISGLLLGAALGMLRALGNGPVRGLVPALPRGLEAWTVADDPRLAALGWAPRLDFESWCLGTGAGA